MALSIESDEADRVARELAATTGESRTDTVPVALPERLERERSRRGGSVAEPLRWLATETADLPVLDERTLDEILGYDDHGLPT